MTTQTTRDWTTTGEALMSYELRRATYHHVDGRCPVCQKLMRGPWMAWDAADGMTIDHLVAHVEGGSDDLGNLIPLCGSCNSSKCDTPLRDWLPGRVVRVGATRAKTTAGQLRFAASLAADLEALAAELKALLTD